MTLKEAIEQRRCRTGQANGTTKDGAYWTVTGLPHEVLIRSFGRDGIGDNAPDGKMYLTFRHYRGGEVRAVIHRHAWHQDGAYKGGGDWYQHVPDLLCCRTAEEVIVALKKARFKGFNDAIFSNAYTPELTAYITALGLPEFAPAPDEAEEVRS